MLKKYLPQHDQADGLRLQMLQRKPLLWFCLRWFWRDYGSKTK